MNDHTHDCGEMQNTNDFVRAEWARKWPNYCHHCEGMGAFLHQDPMMGSIIYDPIEVLDPCEHCVLEGDCPRCGTYMSQYWEYPEPCDECGWAWGTKDGDALPEEYICFGECLRMEV